MVQSRKISYFHHSIITHSSKCSLICLEFDDYAYISLPIIVIQHFIHMRTGNVDQMISKRAFQAWFSPSSRSPDSFSDFRQVHKLSIQVQPFEICHTDEEFSFMSVDVCEIDTQTYRFCMFWSKSSDFHQVHKFLMHHLLIFIKFTSSRFRCQFLNFLIQTGFFFHVSVCMRNRHSVIVLSRH